MGEKRRKLWLYSLIGRIMKDEDSPLRISFNWLCQVVGSDTGILYLREYKEEADRCICFDGGSVREIPAADADAGLLEAARSACVRKQPQYPGGILALPFSCEEADAFGAAAFPGGKVKETKYLDEALASFSRFVYHDLMAGFLESDAPPVLRGRNICMNYSANGSQPNAVDNASFTIGRGQFTVIMGRSGSGKSSLLNILGGMLQPTSGRLMWEGQNIARFGRRQNTAYRRDVVGFIFQNYNLISDLTALENVEVAVSLAREADDAARILERVGLGDKLSSYPSQMSGGEQQRVSIARALVKRPAILLCDEPTGALDTVNARNIMILLQGIARERDIAVVMVTHNPEFIPLADHYIEMENGLIITDIYHPFPFAAEDRL